MKNRDKLVEDNLGLVHSCCQKFKNRGIEYDDLFSSGCMGLIKAIDNFNPDYGLQLSTYAVPVILGEIKQLFRNGGAVKVSRSLKELSMKINKTSNDFQLKHNRPPPVGELAKILETTKEKNPNSPRKNMDYREPDRTVRQRPIKKSEHNRQPNITTIKDMAKRINQL